MAEVVNKVNEGSPHIADRLKAGGITVEVPYPKSTTQMGKREFSHLYEMVEQWAAKREIFLGAA